MVRRVLHLVRRFWFSIWPAGPSAVDDGWARDHLNPDEERLWTRMSRVDRRHAARVARRAVADFGSEVDPTVIVAALMHDVGKTVAGLGTYGRVVATLSVAVAGEDSARLWARGRGITRRVGLYVDYPRLGVDLLALAGSAPLVIAWSREHHLPSEQWTVDPAIGRVLADADDRA